jgi:hypothetical protein
VLHYVTLHEDRRHVGISPIKNNIAASRSVVSPITPGASVTVSA